MNTEKYTLPARWASYLVNRDNSGLDAEERKECDDWLAGHPELASCLMCGEESFYSTSNDASYLLVNNFGGECLDYTFELKGETR